MIYRPTAPQLAPESFLRRYDKNQDKRAKASARGRVEERTDESKEESKTERPGTRRRRSRRDDPSRVARRREQLSASYAVAIEQLAEISAAQALFEPASDAALSQMAEWLPEKASRAYFGLCTLGEALDSHMRELTAEDLAAAAVLNEVALAWIVAITQEMRARVGAEIEGDGLRVGAAYRPGLGRWPLQVQKTIFAELSTEQIGVHLTESLLMLPSFSTSLVIPVIPESSTNTA